MRIHVPSPKPRDEGEFEVRVNPGDAMRDPFAVIALSENSATEICLDDLHDARRLVRVAARALHMLEVSVKGEHHQYRDDCGLCGECGQGRYAAIHAEPVAGSDRTCDEANPDSGAWCHRGGDHGVHEDTDGETWRTDGTEQFISGSPFCTARQDRFLCDLPMGHGGDHRAPGAGEDDEDITWARDAGCYDITGRTA